jgi:RNA polymerase sigma-54 factor
MKNKNVQRASLKLRFVPYLALRARVFEFNNLELNDFINDFFETNPFIEFSNLYSGEDFVFDIPDNEEDIYSFLSHQLNMLELDDKDKKIAQYIINNLNEEGYFKLPLVIVAKEFKVSVKEVERILKSVQSLDPPGIGARNLNESFIIQLGRESPITSKVKKIINDHLQELANGKFDKISKKYGLTKEFLKKLKEKIPCLNPSPGLMLKEAKNLVRVPDIIIEKDGENLNTFLNKNFRREFVINEKYRDILDSLDKDKKEEFEFLLEKAMWLQRAINQREDLLIRISNKILAVNKDFFLGINAYPVKMSLDEFSNSPDLSESVVSRLIQNKYIATPKGLFPVHFFFRRRQVSFNDEEAKAKIKSLIETEDKKRPLSDEQIMQLLESDGIKIKRRTVAKYRMLLNIPNINKRKVDR